MPRRTSLITAEPTARQLQALRFIARHIAVNRFAPSIRQIGDELGISSTNAVADMLWALRRRGLLAWRENQARTFTLSRSAQRLLAAEKRVA